MLTRVEISGIYLWVHDTEFSDCSRWGGPSAIIDVYWRRGYGYRDICKNLQIYYRTAFSAHSREQILKQDLDRYCDNFYVSYNMDLNRYAQCLERYVRTLKWIGK
jgi:hypothetical protein